jgi:RNA polymerase sigma-70 factor (ECF subfamily)
VIRNVTTESTDRHARSAGPSRVASVSHLGQHGGPSDADLVVRGRRGDQWALETLYRRHVQLVAGTARRILRSSSEVEDIVQETFLTAFARLDKLAEPAAFRGWLARIAISRVHRRFRWRKMLSFISGAGTEEDCPLDVEAVAEAGPEMKAELAKIDAVLRGLPLGIRTAWVLRMVEGCTNEEVAMACECSLATAKRRIAEADRTIRAHVSVGLLLNVEEVSDV